MRLLSRSSHCDRTPRLQVRQTTNRPFFFSIFKTSHGRLNHMGTLYQCLFDWLLSGTLCQHQLSFLISGGWDTYCKRRNFCRQKKIVLFRSKPFIWNLISYSQIDQKKKGKARRDDRKACKPGGRKFGMEINFVRFQIYESYEIPYENFFFYSTVGSIKPTSKHFENWFKSRMSFERLISSGLKGGTPLPELSGGAFKGEGYGEEIVTWLETQRMRSERVTWTSFKDAALNRTLLHCKVYMSCICRWYYHGYLVVDSPARQ